LPPPDIGTALPELPTVCSPEADACKVITLPPELSCMLLTVSGTVAAALAADVKLTPLADDFIAVPPRSMVLPLK
jgi:hypothetical protein